MPNWERSQVDVLIRQDLKLCRGNAPCLLRVLKRYLPHGLWGHEILRRAMLHLEGQVSGSSVARYFEEVDRAD